MPRILQPWQLFVAILAGWINEHQQAAIEYLREENRVRKEQLGEKRPRLTDDQHRRLAAKGKALGDPATIRGSTQEVTFGECMSGTRFEVALESLGQFTSFETDVRRGP